MYRFCVAGSADRRVVLSQRERVRGGAVGSQVANAVFGVIGGGPISGGHPPTCGVRLGHPLEPLTSPAQHLAVQLAEHEFGQVLDVAPHRQVHDDTGTAFGVPAERVDRGGVAVLGLQPPHEAGCNICRGVDRVEAVTKSASCGSSRGAANRATFTCASSNDMGQACPTSVSSTTPGRPTSRRRQLKNALQSVSDYVRHSCTLIVEVTWSDAAAKHLARSQRYPRAVDDIDAVEIDPYWTSRVNALAIIGYSAAAGAVLLYSPTATWTATCTA